MKPMIKHSAKPAKQKLLKLCRDARFKEKVGHIRTEQGIQTLIKLPGESDKLLERLGKASQEDWYFKNMQYPQDTRKGPFIRDIEVLCNDFNIPQEAWFLLFTIVLCFDLDNISMEDIENLGMQSSIARTNTLYGLEKRKRHHLYLDVTFATIEDVKEIWNLVLEWHINVRPRLIEEGKLPDLLEDIKAGRPQITDDICLECARLKDKDGWSYVRIGKHFGFPLQKNPYGKRTQCRTAQATVKRGRSLIEAINLHT